MNSNCWKFRRGAGWFAIWCFGAFVALLLAQPALALRTFRVQDYGARGDGKTLDTPFIQRALDAAGAAGGGDVTFEPGVYLTGSLFVKSHTHLIVGQGVTILGTSDAAAYPRIWTRAAGVEMFWPAALININKQSDVTLDGKGTIDGNGKLWWDRFWKLVPAYQSRGLRWAVDYDVQRPELIQVYKSSHVRIGGGLLLRRSAFWTVHLCFSSHIVVSDLTIRDNDPVGERGPSTDGVDIDSSRHVLVQRVDISNNDDGICLKAGMNADGLRVDRPTEDVVIRDCIVRQGISGFAIGSDTAGGFKNVRVSHLTVLSGVRYGIYIKSTHTRGGWTRNIHITGVRMQGVKVGIMVDLNYFPAFSTPVIPPGIEKNLPPGLSSIPTYWRTLTEPVPAERGIPHFRDITIADVTGTGLGTAISMSGSKKSPLEDFTLRNIHLEAQKAGEIRYADNLKLRNVEIQSQDHQPLVMEETQRAK